MIPKIIIIIIIITIYNTALLNSVHNIDSKHIEHGISAEKIVTVSASEILEFLTEHTYVTSYK